MKCSVVHCNLLPSNICLQIYVIELFGNIKTQFFLSKKT